MSPIEITIRLRDVLRETLAPLLPRGEPYALLDYPAHANVGDSAMWLGTLALLRENGAGPPAYSCTTKTYDPGTLRRSVGEGPILVAGGGNFGDLYASHQALRERVARDFPTNPILQLPQTIHFERDASLHASRRALEAHPDFTLLVRDEESLSVARDRLEIKSLLCPDLAFALAPLRCPPTTRGEDIVWLLRGDREGGNCRFVDAVDAVDWPRDPARGLFAIQRRLRKRVARAPSRRARLAHHLWRTFTPAARRRLYRGCTILGAGRAVVTNRIHGHVLCLLLGIPHVVLDNNYGKNRRFFETWTHDAPSCHWSDGSPEECRGLLDGAWNPG